MTTYPHEYEIRISTGETLLITEFDPLRFEEKEAEWIRSGPPELKACTRISRQAIESAIRGNDAPLRKAMGVQPIGALAMLKQPLCGDRDSCPMFNRRMCSAVASERKKRQKIMHCWSYGSDSPSREIMTLCVDAWSSGRYVFIVE